MLNIVASYHCVQFQGKLMNQTWNNGKKPVSGPILAPLAQICPPLPKKKCYEFYLTRCYKLLQAIIVFNFKEN